MGSDERLSMLQGRSGGTAVFSKRQSLQGMKTEWEEGLMQMNCSRIKGDTGGCRDERTSLTPGSSPRHGVLGNGDGADGGASASSLLLN